MSRSCAAGPSCPDMAPQDTGGGPDKALPRLLDAWTTYAINPRRWRDLIRELERHSDALAGMDPNHFLAAFSKAESLSWRLRSDGSHAPDGFSYLLLDAQGRIVESVDDEELLDDYLHIDRHKLTFAHPDADAAWRAFIDAPGTRPRYRLLRLATAEGTHQRYCYVVGADDLPTHLRLPSADVAMALLIPAADASPQLRQTLQSSFGLTDAECRLTLALVTGDSLREAAANLGVAVNTVRNQLQSVFTKTSISRQSDLILVVAQLGVIVATSGDGPVEATQSSLPERRFHALTSGRQLAYRLYGNPHGKPVVHLHETFGTSRLPERTQALASAHNLCLIVPDRPGFGFSSAPPHATFDAINDDLEEFIDHFAWPALQLSAYLSGAGFALGLAQRLGTRVTRLLLVAGRSPKSFSNEPQSGAWMDRVRLRLVDHPWLLGSFFNILRNRTSTNLNRALLMRVYGEVTSDREFLQDNHEALHHLVESTLDAQSTSAAGVIADIRAYASEQTLRIDALEQPITAWHGDADLVANIADLKRYLAPFNAQFTIFPGEGSMVFLRHFEQWLQELATAPIQT